MKHKEFVKTQQKQITESIMNISQYLKGTKYKLIYIIIKIANSLNIQIQIFQMMKKKRRFTSGHIFLVTSGSYGNLCYRKM